MARIFLSYAREDFALAEKLYFALVNLDHHVFLDKKILKAGQEYNFKIIDEIRSSDFAVLLLSPEFFDEGSYCRTELKVIQTHWQNPNGKVVPVIIRDVPFEIIPNYIKSITILKAQGDPVAETVHVIEDNLRDFNPDDSISNKLFKLELKQQIESLDNQWAIKKKDYYVTVNNKETRPTRFSAFFSLIIFIAFGAFGFFAFSSIAPDFFGIWPAVIPPILGLLSFIYINLKVSRLKSAEKKYLKERNDLLLKMPKE